MQSSYRIAAETEKLIDSTMRLWQQRMRRDISREDARQIIELVTAFFDVLTGRPDRMGAGVDDSSE